MVVPDENMHFHDPEPLKNQRFRFFSIFMRHGSSRIDTNLSKPCKFHIFGRTVQFGIQLHGTRTGSRSIPSISQSGIQDSHNPSIQGGTCGAGLHRAAGVARRRKFYTNSLGHAFTSSLKQTKSSFRGKINPSFSVVAYRIERSKK